MGWMALPFGGRIKMTLVTRSSPLIFLLQILSVQDPFLFPNGPDESSPPTSASWAEASVAATWVSANDLIKCLWRFPPHWDLWDGIYAILGISVLLESEAGTEPMTRYSNARRSEVRQSPRPALLAEVLSQWVSCKHTQKTCHGGGGDLVAKSCSTLVTPWTIAHKTPLSIALSRQEY